MVVKLGAKPVAIQPARENVRTNALKRVRTAVQMTVLANVQRLVQIVVIVIAPTDVQRLVLIIVVVAVIQAVQRPAQIHVKLRHHKDAMGAATLAVQAVEDNVIGLAAALVINNVKVLV